MVLMVREVLGDLGLNRSLEEGMKTMEGRLRGLQRGGRSLRERNFLSRCWWPVGR